MKKNILGFVWLTLLLAGWVGACASRTTEGDSESHFLRTCSGSCDGGLQCVCGVCTKPCVSDETCSVFGEGAACAGPVTCGGASGRICTRQCSAPSDCGSGLECRGGTCSPKGEGTSGGTGGSSGAHADASADGATGGGAGGGESTDGAAGGGTGGRGIADSGRSSFADVGAPDAQFGWLDLDTLPAAPVYLDWHGEPLDPPGTSGCCTPGDIYWTQAGGADSTLNRLTRCSYYLRGAAHPNEDCIASLSCGGDRVSPTDVAAILDRADVRAAFTAAPTAFGLATGLTDVITIDGNRVSIGASCAGAPGCTDAPADLLSLVTTLHQLGTQQLGWDCRPSVDCYAPIDPGPCDGSFPRFGYDVVSGTCQPFTYGGCAGTANRFETLAACQQACKLDPCHAGHPVDPDAGFCIHAGPYCLEDPNAACGCACMYGTNPGETPHECTASGNVMTCVH